MKMKIVTIQPRFKYDALKFSGDIKEIEEFLSSHKFKLLDHESNKKSRSITVYYLDNYRCPRQFEVKKNHYIWIDELGLINSATQSHINEYYNIEEERIKC